MKTSVQVPSLNHDSRMFTEFGQKVTPNGRLERRIVANLIAHMEACGWHVASVYDGEEDTAVTDMKSAMELIFNLDESRLYFSNGHNSHQILLVVGNGVDIVSDWGYRKGDADGFNAACESFAAEEFA